MKIKDLEGGPKFGEGHPLPFMLQVAVPLLIWELKTYPPDVRLETVQRWAKEAETTLAETGEAILYRTKSGESARAFNALAKGIAALSFVPGGVTVFGDHWETKL